MTKIKKLKDRVIYKIGKSFLFPKELRINKNGQNFIVNSEKNYFFWNSLRKGKWEPETFAIFDKFLDKQHSYIDLGAWRGPTVLYGSQLAKHCYAVEPDPIAFLELKRNVELNKDLISRITLSDSAINNTSGTTHLYFGGEGGNSGSSILFNETKSSTEVKCITFQEFIKDNSITDCNFIKMDIEGGEFIVLPTMFDYLKINKPTLFIELHPMFIEDIEQKFNEIKKVINIYDYVYTDDMKEVNLNSILFSLKNESEKTLQIVLTTKS